MRFLSQSPTFLHLNLKSSAQILFVVQARERNVFDQRWLEYELLEQYMSLLSERVKSLILSAGIRYMYFA